MVFTQVGPLHAEAEMPQAQGPGAAQSTGLLSQLAGTTEPTTALFSELSTKPSSATDGFFSSVPNNTDAAAITTKMKAPRIPTATDFNFEKVFVNDM